MTRLATVSLSRRRSPPSRWGHKWLSPLRRRPSLPPARRALWILAIAEMEAATAAAMGEVTVHRMPWVQPSPKAQGTLSDTNDTDAERSLLPLCLPPSRLQRGATISTRVRRLPAHPLRTPSGGSSTPKGAAALSKHLGRSRPGLRCGGKVAVDARAQRRRPPRARPRRRRTRRAA